VDYLDIYTAFGLLNLGVELAIPITIVALGKRLGRWRPLMLTGAMLAVVPVLLELIFWLAWYRRNNFEVLVVGMDVRTIIALSSIGQAIRAVGWILLLVGIVGIARDLHTLRQAESNATQVFSDFPVPTVPADGSAAGPVYSTDLAPPA